MVNKSPIRRKSLLNRRRLKLLSFVVLLLTVGVLAVGFRLFQRSTKQTTPISVSANVPSGKVVGNYLFSGTIVLARAVEKYAYGNYNQPFGGIDTLGSYDARIGVLECPVTNNYDSYENEVNNLVFNCKPAWIPYLKQYYPILNLSSDHLNDQGPQGISDTFKYLSADGVQTVGTYDPHSLKDDCKTIILPAHIIRGSKTTAVSLPIAMCSYNYKFLFQPAPGELESINKWSKLMPVIALLNEGPEYHHTASAQAVSIAHKMIDEGADFVVGNGTHWVQNTEVYKGKLIVYSMGNFIFDQLDYDGRIALNLAVTTAIPYSNNVNGWLAIAHQCQVQPENCLAIAKNKHLSRYTIEYNFKAIGSYGGDRVVTARANASQQEDIERLANWQTTLKELGQTN